MAKMRKSPSAPSHRPYTLRISRLTVDKLGVKLYDKVAAVVAEECELAEAPDRFLARLTAALNGQRP